MTLALYGKTRRRQAALVFAGFLAVVAGSLYGLSTQGDEAKAASQVFPVSATSCADAGASPCSPTVAGLNDIGTTMILDMFPPGGADDDLTVSFDLSSIPVGSTLNSAILSFSTTGIVGAAGAFCNLWVGSSASAESDAAYNSWGINPGSAVLNVNSLGLLGAGYPNLTNHVQAALGGTFTVRLSVDCNYSSFNTTPAGVVIDKIAMTVDWTPPPPAASGAKTSDEAGGDGAVDVGEDFSWVVTVTVANGNSTGHTEISDTIQSPLVIRAGTWDLDDGTGSGTLTCPDQTGPDIWCRVNSGSAPGTYVVKIPVEVPTGVLESVCDDQINNVATLSGTDVSGTSVQVSASVDLNPCPPTRTVRVVKVTNTPLHDGGSFGGSISPGQITPSDATTWDATLAENADHNAPGQSFETSQTQQTVTEAAPSGGWVATGFAEVSDTGQTACPDPVSGNYTADGVVPAGNGDVLVCVRNTYVVVAYEKSDTGDGTYAPGENINWEITATVTGGPTVSSITFWDTLPTGLVFAGFTGLDAGSCIFATGVISCDFGSELTAGEYGVRFNLTAALTGTCGPVVNEARDASEGGNVLASHSVNIECPDPRGSLRLEKYLDINRDGDADDPGERLVDDWPITITSNNVGLGIAGNYLTGQGTDPTGTLVFDGLDAGDSYDISEGTLPGYVVVKATVNGANLGAVTSLTDVVIPDGGTTVVRFYNSPSGSITVHKNTINVVNGIESANLDDDDNWRITATSAACAVSVSGVTDANGNITFSGLELCGDYVVAEDLSVPGAPGYSTVGGPSRTGIQPGFSAPTVVTFTNETRSTTPPCPNCSGAGPTTFQATPAATPVTPGATPTTAPATPTVAPATPTIPPATATPDGAVAGEQPAGVITPVAPSTGDYLTDRDTGMSLLVILAGAMAIVAGAGALAMGSRR